MDLSRPSPNCGYGSLHSPSLVSLSPPGGRGTHGADRLFDRSKGVMRTTPSPRARGEGKGEGHARHGEGQ